MDEFSEQPKNQKIQYSMPNLNLFGVYLMQSFVGKYLNAQKVMTVEESYWRSGFINIIIVYIHIMSQL